MRDCSLLKSIAICCLLFIGPTASAQEGPDSKEKQLYNQLKAFSLTGGTVEVKGLALKIEDQPGGKAIISGIVSQKNAPWDWMMVLPVKFSFAEKQFAFGTVLVQGAYSPFQIELPARPKKVELDPDRWILAEATSTKELK